jgi:penicillin G amidase
MQLKTIADILRDVTATGTFFVVLLSFLIYFLACTVFLTISIFFSQKVLATVSYGHLLASSFVLFLLLVLVLHGIVLGISSIMFGHAFWSRIYSCFSSSNGEVRTDHQELQKIGNEEEQATTTEANEEEVIMKNNSENENENEHENESAVAEESNPAMEDVTEHSTAGLETSATDSTAMLPSSAAHEIAPSYGHSPMLLFPGPLDGVTFRLRDWIWLIPETVSFLLLQLLVVVEIILIVCMAFALLLDYQAHYLENGAGLAPPPPPPDINHPERSAFFLQSAVVITRDAQGIPHITAETTEDAHYGLGWSHARDRLFQLELHRRVASATLSEILGPVTLDADRFARRAGIPYNARKHFSYLDHHTQEQLQAYVAGINAFIESAWLYPLEFYVLGIRPSHWLPENCVGFGQVMSIGFSKSWKDDLRRYEMMKERDLSQSRVEQLSPAYGAFLPTILTNSNLNSTLSETNFVTTGNANGDDTESHTTTATKATKKQEKKPEKKQEKKKLSGATSVMHALKTLNDLFPYFFGEVIGSNSWVVGGGKTKTGRPFVVNDPHLSFSSPMIWHFSHMRVKDGSDVDLVGAFFPGAPAVLVGHNSHGSWGITIGYADLSDVFVIDAIDAKTYRYGDAILSYDERVEYIQVRGQPLPERLNIRLSSAGPIISDSGFDSTSQIGNDNSDTTDVLALAWTSTTIDTSLDAFHALSHAKNLSAFTTAVAKWTGPGVNLVYGNKDGDIAYYSTGRLPIRAAGVVGDFPVTYGPTTAWLGVLDPSSNPSSINPEESMLFTANEKVVPFTTSYKYNIQPSNRDFHDGMRSQILRSAALERLSWSSRQDLSATDMKQLQLDLISGTYYYFSPMLARIASDPSSTSLQRLWASRLVNAWNGTCATDSKYPSVYEGWLIEMFNVGSGEVYDTEGEEPDRKWGNRFYLLRLLYNSTGASIADSQYQSSDSACIGGGDCLKSAQAALTKAVETLLGGNEDEDSIPDYGQMHQGSWQHILFQYIPVLQEIYGRRAPLGGDGFSVNCAGVEIAGKSTWTAKYGASIRMIVDTDDFDASQFILPLGEVASPWSPYFDNFFQPYLQSQYVEIRRSDYSSASQYTIHPSILPEASTP